MPPPSKKFPHVSSALPQSFNAKKKSILEQLSTPSSDYQDDSPKGSLDEGIRELIDEINSFDGFVTTSSCSGRIAIFLEGQKSSTESSTLSTAHSSQSVRDDEPMPDEAQRTDTGGETSFINDDRNEEILEKESKGVLASTGGKGGGKWLFVSHDPVDVSGTVKNSAWAKQQGMVHLPDGTKMGLQEMAGLRLIHFKFEPMVNSFLHLTILSIHEVVEIGLLTNS